MFKLMRKNWISPSSELYSNLLTKGINAWSQEIDVLKQSKCMKDQSRMFLLDVMKQLHENKYDDAVPLLEKAVELDPENEIAWELFGNYHVGWIDGLGGKEIDWRRIDTVEDESFHKAVECWTNAANAGNAKAAYVLAQLFRNGYRVETSLQTMYNFLSIAESLEEGRLEMSELILQDKMMDHEDSLKLIEDDPNAISLKARYYLQGEGVDKDIDRGLNLLREGAKNNDPASLFWLGQYCLKGEYLEKDLVKGIDYLDQSAAHAYPPALQLLGYCLFSGIGIRKHRTRGLEYTCRAARYWNPDAFTVITLGIFSKAASKSNSLQFFTRALYHFLPIYYAILGYIVIMTWETFFK